MGSESTMRTRVCKILKKFDAQAVENRVGPGMPDIVCVTKGVWIECKKTAAFPKHADSIVRLDHELLATQKVWLMRCYRRGGTAYVLTQIANEFFLHRGQDAAEVLGFCSRATLTESAALHCVGWAELEFDLPDYL